MFRIFFFILAIAAVSYGLAELAKMDGQLVIQWPGGEVQPSFMQAVLLLFVIVFLLLLAWRLFRAVLSSPETLTRYFTRKKNEKGLAALSGGFIALNSGDRDGAMRLARQARKTLPNDPMTLMLRAQAAELEGDTAKATRLYESMLASSDTEIMGLRGLYLLALEQKAYEPAGQYAARAVRRRKDLKWAVMGLFDLLSKRGKWAEALETLNIAQTERHIEPRDAKRYRAVLLTGLAMELEDQNADEALLSAREACRLAPNLVPAAVTAGRIFASKGQMSQALTVIRKCWRQAPHPDLALVSAYARPGDSVRDRLRRIQSLAELTPGHREAAMAVARAAMEAKDWSLARASLGPLVRGEPSQHVCTLMARVEAAESGNKGLVREWLSRAVHARPDPQWVADGKAFDEWAPVSPISGQLDAFEWKVPEALETEDNETLSLKQMISGLLTAEGLETTSEGTADHFETAVEVVEDGSDKNLPVVVDIEKTPGLDETAEKDENPDDEVTDLVRLDGEDNIDGENNIEGSVSSTGDGNDDAVPEAAPEKETPEALAASEKKAKKGKRKRSQRTKIFVPPPAPDDPGIEADDSGEDPQFVKAMRPLRY